jgi:NADPH oxidase
MAVWLILHSVAFALAMIHYALKDSFVGARGVFAYTFSESVVYGHILMVVIARGSAQVLHIDIVFILFPVCRNFISMLRKSPLGRVVPFDKNIEFHSEYFPKAEADQAEQVAWMVVLFSVIHIVAHMRNFVSG